MSETADSDLLQKHSVMMHPYFIRQDLSAQHAIHHTPFIHLHSAPYHRPLKRSSQNAARVQDQAKSTGAQSQLAAYCGAFRTSPHTPQPLNHSWVAPLVAPARSDPATEPPEYRFASRAPAVRRSPANKDPRQKSAHRGHPSVSPANGKLSTSSCAHQPYARAAPEQFDSHTMRHYDWDGQYDEFLASFQHRIDGMTGQRGGWGF